ncbi:MAG TPA: 2Fe-2S iron-sulfur cluster-binding protein [Anaerolineales bacterium]|nr:2Fe-2S iron-sulfur cluster-binding protein [Anaerolineales bacterium]
MSPHWTVKISIFRKKGESKEKFDSFTMDVDPDEYVLDAVERIWAYRDRSLTFAHACHHSVCGACGMRVNGIEKLACITPIRSVVEDRGEIRLDPLRNFAVVSDLVVDMGPLFRSMERVGAEQVLPIEETTVDDGIQPAGDRAESQVFRLVDCIECGLCLSACPIVATSPGYLGPAVLAAVQQRGLKNAPHLVDQIDSQDGVWRCHGIHECTEVCPSNVQPAWRIMDLRRQAIRHRLSKFFDGGKETG